MHFACGPSKLNIPVSTAAEEKESNSRTGAPAVLRGELLRYHLKTTPFDNIELQLLKAFFDEHAVNGSLSVEKIGQIFNFGKILREVVFRKFVQRRGPCPPIKKTPHIKKKKNESGGEFTFTHFLQTTIYLGPRATSSQRMVFAFNLFDENGDGIISKLEFETILLDCLNRKKENGRKKENSLQKRASQMIIDSDQNVLNTHVKRGWEDMLKGTGVNELNFTHFQNAMSVNPKILEMLELDQEWVDRILVRELEKDGKTKIVHEVDDSVHAFLSTILLECDPKTIDTVRETLREHLCNNVSDIQSLDPSHFSKMNIAPHIIKIIKKNLKPLDNKEVKFNTEVRSANLFKSICAFVFIFTAIITVLVHYTTYTRIDIDEIRTTLFIGRLFAYLSYMTMYLTLVCTCYRLTSKILTLHRMKDYVIDFKRWGKRFLFIHIITSIAHGITHFITYYYIEEKLEETMANSITTVQGICGLVGFVLILLILFLRLQCKVSNSECFSISQVTLYIYFLAILIHAAVGYQTDKVKIHSLLSWLLLIPIMVIFLIEKYYMYSNTSWSYMINANPKLGKVLYLRTHRPSSFYYHCGQYTWIQCKEINLSWRPVFITSSPLDSSLSFHISVNNEWSHALYERCLSTPLPLIKIRGSFGRSREYNYKKIVFITADDGILPASSSLHYLIQLLADPYSQLENVHFYWIAKQYTNFQWFYELLVKLQKSTPRFVAHIFMTQQENDDTLSALMLNIKSFSYSNIPKLSFYPSEDSKSSAVVSKMKRRKSSKVVSKSLSLASKFRETDPKFLEGNTEVKIGPPDLNSLFTKLKHQNPAKRKSQRHLTIHNENQGMGGKAKNTEVGVFFLGSNILSDLLRSMCKKYSDCHMKFVFHHNFVDGTLYGQNLI